MDKFVQCQNTISIPFNYTIIRASNDLLLDILCREGDIVSQPQKRRILSLIDNPTEKFASYLVDLLKRYNGKYVNELKVERKHNLVPLVLRESLALLNSGTDITPTLKCNEIALGSGSTTPANSDTTLDTETLRATFTQRNAVSNVCYLDKFFPSTTVGGNTYNEIGVFVDGTASADTGYLFSRVLINQVMAANETLTINVTITYA